MAENQDGSQLCPSIMRRCSSEEAFAFVPLLALISALEIKKNLKDLLASMKCKFWDKVEILELVQKARAPCPTKKQPTSQESIFLKRAPASICDFELDI